MSVIVFSLAGMKADVEWIAVAMGGPLILLSLFGVEASVFVSLVLSLLGFILFQKLPGDWFWVISWLAFGLVYTCLLYTSPSPRDQRGSRMPSSA